MQFEKQKMSATCSCNQYILKPVNVSDHLDTIYQYEVESYPEDEAATYEKLKYRLETANPVFRGWFCVLFAN